MGLPIAVGFRTGRARRGWFNCAAAAVVLRECKCDLAAGRDRPTVAGRDDLTICTERQTAGSVRVTKIGRRLASEAECRIEYAGGVVASETEIDMCLDVENVGIDFARQDDFPVRLDDDVIRTVEAGEEIRRSFAAGS